MSPDSALIQGVLMDLNTVLKDAPESGGGPSGKRVGRYCCPRRWTPSSVFSWQVLKTEPEGMGADTRASADGGLQLE